MKYALVLVAGLLIALQPSMAGGRCPALRFDLRQNLSVAEFAELAAEVQQPKSGGAPFLYWWFDSENYPVQKGWSAVALVLAANGDIGETPVAGIIWSNRPLDSRHDFDVRNATPGDKVGAAFTGGIVFATTNHVAGCEPASLTFSSDGTKVFLDGKLIGTIKN